MGLISLSLELSLLCHFGSKVCPTYVSVCYVLTMSVLCYCTSQMTFSGNMLHILVGIHCHVKVILVYVMIVCYLHHYIVFSSLSVNLPHSLACLPDPILSLYPRACLPSFLSCTVAYCPLSSYLRPAARPYSLTSMLCCPASTTVPLLSRM